MATPVLTFRPHPSRAHTVVVLYENYEQQHIISFGNGHTIVRNPGQVATFDYAAAGWYRVEAKAMDDTVLAGKEVRVVDSVTPAFGTWGPNKDNADFYEITFADDGTGIASKVDIYWGVPNSTETVWATPGGTAMRDLPAGSHDITITDHGSGRKSTTNHKITGRAYDPDATIELDSTDKSKMTVKVTLNAVDGKKGAITVWWDQGVSDKIDNPVVGNTKTHKYTTADTYLVVVEYSDGSSGDNATTDLITVGTP